ncbi:MAG TPA: DUF1588 domain-containing protein [Polyangiaceae bacterium]|nr:DUF1588 domain-containing protein [Polyangiaceae bacterium]
MACGGLAACAGSSGKGAPQEGPAADAPAPICAAPDGTLGTAPLRRLTGFEYGRTLADLTGADPSVASELVPDEESFGFDDQADTYSISTLHASKYFDVATSAATTLVADTARLSAFAGCDPTADAACVEPFVRAFGRRAYRRSLTDDEVAAMVALDQVTASPGPADGVSAVVAAMLQSPQVLYRPEPSAPNAAFGPALATRLSYLITASTPDDTLLDAAEGGALDTTPGLLAQADRLLASPRAAEAFSHFMFEWWDLEGLDDLQKDTALYRTWDSSVPGELELETQAFLTGAWTATPSLDVILGAPYTFLDWKLINYYGVAGADAPNGFVQIALDPTRAAGMLTQGSFLALHAKADQTSPTLRGKFVRELFCDPPPPPPPTIVVTPPAVDPRLSTRQRFAQHTADPTCAGCHQLMDPIGFLFEHYDAIGRWRDVDGGQPVDSTGYIVGTDVDGNLDGVPALAQALLQSDEVRTCVATQWFRYAFGHDATSDADTCTVSALASELAATNGDLKRVIRATVEQQLFQSQRPEEAAP